MDDEDKDKNKEHRKLDGGDERDDEDKDKDKDGQGAPSRRIVEAQPPFHDVLILPADHMANQQTPSCRGRPTLEQHRSMLRNADIKGVSPGPYPYPASQRARMNDLHLKTVGSRFGAGLDICTCNATGAADIAPTTHTFVDNRGLFIHEEDVGMNIPGSFPWVDGACSASPIASSRPSLDDIGLSGESSRMPGAFPPGPGPFGVQVTDGAMGGIMECVDHSYVQYIWTLRDALSLIVGPERHNYNQVNTGIRYYSSTLGVVVVGDLFEVEKDKLTYVAWVSLPNGQRSPMLLRTPKEWAGSTKWQRMKKTIEHIFRPSSVGDFVRCQVDENTS
ncbi:hypothetical protein BV22DRAFT_1052397 [Leucogyrophana mollusca]|uniref:Uncharacterized protein n=1 Tax=Leucogyrophana mollusca TaxID=85980 RepID=A0ACB8AWP9_9AGAM|nr:hypothetical protein BV22DRAFT_1052397 [Leucogyrophana mollusca]